MEMIKIKNFSKKYENVSVYQNFNLEIEEGKTTVILGESGSGKTTLINAIASLIDYDGKIEGDIYPLSMVFSKNRLAENLTVEQNLKLVCPSVDVLPILKEVGLEGCKDDYPKSLSAGMARRVSVARALLYPSKTLLMDEPLINLDVALKFSLMNMIKEKQKKEGKSIIFVTHDIKEAVYMGDRIIVLKGGRVIYDNSKITKKTEEELFGLMISCGNEL